MKQSHPGGRKHAGLGGSRNCRDLPLVEKRAQRENKSLDGEEATTPPCTDLSTYELGVENGGKSLYISTLFSYWYYFISATLKSLLGWWISQASDKSNDLLSLFSLWSRQSRDTIQPYRAWQARFPLERKIHYHIFLLSYCLLPIILKRSLQKHKQRNIFPDVPVLPVALQLRIYRDDYGYSRCPPSPPLPRMSYGWLVTQEGKNRSVCLLYGKIEAGYSSFKFELFVHTFQTGHGFFILSSSPWTISFLVSLFWCWKYPCGVSCVKSHLLFVCPKSATCTVCLPSYTFEPPYCPLWTCPSSFLSSWKGERVGMWEGARLHSAAPWVVQALKVESLPLWSSLDHVAFSIVHQHDWSCQRVCGHCEHGNGCSSHRFALSHENMSLLLV